MSRPDSTSGGYPTPARARLNSPSALDGIGAELLSVTSEHSLGFARQAQAVMALGCRRLGMGVALLSRVSGDAGEVVAAVELYGGRAASLEDPCAGLVLKHGGPVGWRGGELPGAPRAALEELGLRSYFGVPVVVDGEDFGVLAFCDPDGEGPPLGDDQRELMSLLSAWLGSELYRARSAQALKRLTRIDPLTQLLNRRGAEHAMERLFKRASHDGAALTAVLIDLDDFKRINDDYSHDVGDLVLMEVAERIRASVRERDLVARVGGDEFLAVLPESSPEQSLHVAGRIRRAIASAPVETPSGAIEVRASLGISLIGEGPARVTNILRQVSPKLKESKRKGKDRVSR